MTPAERALLLALGNNASSYDLRQLTAAVEAEAAPDREAVDEMFQRIDTKSCKTCERNNRQCYPPDPRVRLCDEWQPKPSVCPTCGGDGQIEFKDAIGWSIDTCPDCDGTGEEKK